MLFNSFIFLVFLAVIVPAYYVLPGRFRGPFLLGVSYFFYGYWDWRFCGLLLLTTAVDFTVARKLAGIEGQRSRRMTLLVSLVINLGILAFFKYFNFFADSFAAVLGRFGLHTDMLHLNVLLPVGVSFYTFKSLSYVIDVYRRQLEPTRSFLDYAQFVAFFPQLVAGPIERARGLLPQISRHSTPTPEQLKAGFVLITVGMFKKVLIGDTSGRFVDHIFAGHLYYSSPELLAGLLLFAVQIYADFSGYSSIARGAASLIGIDTMENFRQPYLSSNITEFWRRWHISLSTWLRDYIFLPIAYSTARKVDSFKRVRLNYEYTSYVFGMLITMLIGGLWHGASYTFVVWGGLHGLYLGMHKLMYKKRKAVDRYHYKGVPHLVVFLLKVAGTFTLVLLTWLFFRAPSFQTAFSYLSHILWWQGGEFTSRFAVITLTYLLVTLALDLVEYWTQDPLFLLRIRSAGFRYGLAAACWFVTLLYMFQSQPMPFIYFQF